MKRRDSTGRQLRGLRRCESYFFNRTGEKRGRCEVQKNLGHTQIKTTQRYAHLSQDTLIDAANVVPFTMAVPMVSTVKAGSAGLILGLR